MSALFETLQVRPMRNGSGVLLPSSIVHKIYERSAYGKGDRAVPFAKKLVDVCNAINSGADVALV